jgi:hypothetical protein
MVSVDCSGFDTHMTLTGHNRDCNQQGQVLTTKNESLQGLVVGAVLFS